MYYILTTKRITVFIFFTVLLYSGTMIAADVATIIGAPGSFTWNAACPVAPVPQVPAGTSQLPACAGPNPDCLHRVDIDPVEFPNAVCSDGTPGVFYIRPGSGDDANRWVVHIQGGGGCRNYDDCLARWCGQQGALPYTANKMSSDWDADGSPDLADHVAGPGMASSSVNNQFATWTHVWAYYCSSDSWQGRATDVAFSGTNSFTLDARGHTILYAMRKMLRKNNNDPAWTAVHGFATPDIDDATDIVLTGTSAGAKGAITNADWFLATFPNAETSLVVDANFDVSDNVIIDNDIWVDLDGDGIGDNTYFDERVNSYNAMWAAGGRYAEINAFTDQTCRTVFQPLGQMYRCGLFSAMLNDNRVLPFTNVPIIETPTFVRYDLEDNAVSRRYTQHPNIENQSLLIGGQFGTPTTLDDAAFLSRESLIETYNDHDSLTGVIGPRCGKHVGLEDSYTFGVTEAPNTIDFAGTTAIQVGSFITTHDALWSWLNVGGVGRDDIRRLDTGRPGLSFSLWCN